MENDVRIIYYVMENSHDEKPISVNLHGNNLKQITNIFKYY